jgi:1-acyl-sn-glycerol-3-phosphate acyltransferase
MTDQLLRYYDRTGERIVPALRFFVACSRMFRVVYWVILTLISLRFCKSASAVESLIRQRAGQILISLHVRVATQDLNQLRCAPSLIVSNHISWLDAVALASCIDSVFVVKAEVIRWPVVGSLCRAAHAIPITRGSNAGLCRALELMEPALRAGKNVVVFPEGTTSCGDSVLPFANGCFQAAIDAGRPIQPLLIAYRNSNHSKSFAFVGEDSFVASFWRLCNTEHTTVSLTILQSLAVGNSRKQLALAARATIVTAQSRHKNDTFLCQTSFNSNAL